MQLKFYIDKFFHAERLFNAVRLEDNYEVHSEYSDFKAFLNGHCFVYPVPFVTIDNLLPLHFVWWDYKIAINFHLKKLSIPKHGRSSEMQKLPAKLMRQEKWEILDLDEAEFDTWEYE